MPHQCIVRIAVHDEKDNFVCLATLGEIRAEKGAPLNAIFKQFDIKSVIGPPQFFPIIRKHEHDDFDPVWRHGKRVVVIPTRRQKRAGKPALFLVQGRYIDSNEMGTAYVRFPQKPIKIRCVPHPEAMSAAFAAALQPYANAEGLVRTPEWPDMQREMHISKNEAGVYLFNYISVLKH